MYVPEAAPSFLYDASAGKSMSVSRLSSTELVVRGLRIDNVTLTERLLPIGQVDTSMQPDLLRPKSRLGNDWLLSRSKLMVRDTCGGRTDNERSLQRAAENADAHFAAFAAFVVDALGEKSITKTYIPLQRFWCDNCRAHLSSSMDNSTIRPVRLSCAVCETGNFDLCQQCYEAGGHGCTHSIRALPITSLSYAPDSRTWNRLEAAARNGDGTGFGGRVRSQTWLKTFFATATGWIGMRPRTMRASDIVVVFYGGRTPFVVRDKGNHVFLVGPCYVHGLMDGEPVAVCESGELFEEDFELR